MPKLYDSFYGKMELYYLLSGDGDSDSWKFRKYNPKLWGLDEMEKG